ncbi:hypothetical protein KCL53_002452 [Clostridium perfringens]|nr:hypothetical protein [Clostridium perfringens]
MWFLRNNFKKLVIQYNQYFNVKEEVRDYIDLKRKIIKQLRRKTKRELENLKLELSITTNKRGVSWDNYISLRLANIAIVVSGISILIQSYPELIPNLDKYIIFLLIFSSIVLYSFSYKDEKEEDKKAFLLFILSCIDEVLEEKISNIKRA